MDTKKALSSKTIWVALAITILGALEVFDWTTILESDVAGYVVFGIGIVMGILRKITTTAIK